MILYKYIPQNLLSVIDNEHIRFTPPGAFNDPFEFKPVLSQVASNQEIEKYILEHFDEILEKELLPHKPIFDLIPKDILNQYWDVLKKQIQPFFRTLEPMLIKKMNEEFEKGFNEHFGVLCLSNSWDSILMWGHYASSHSGYVIGFDSKNEFFSDSEKAKKDFGYIREVTYTNKRPVVRLMNSDSLDWFYTKNEVWNYEGEYRILKPLFNADQKKEINGEMIHLFKFPRESIKEVILGSKIDRIKKNCIMKVCTERKIPVFESSLDDRLFKLNRKRL